MAGFIITLFIVAIILGVTLSIIHQSKINKRVQSEAVARGAYDGVVCSHIEGLGVGDVRFRVLAFDEVLQIESISGGPTYTIPYNRVRKLTAMNEKEFQGLFSSDAAQRAGSGTITGDLSGLKAKKKGDAASGYLIINYADTSGELKRIIVRENMNLPRLTSFAWKVNDRIGSAQEGSVVQL